MQPGPETAEIVIVGGGPAGAAAACELARAGADVLVLERALGPHDKVCGEFISGEAAAMLGRLGLDLPAEGAQPIRSVRLFGRAATAESRLPFPAFGLSRRRLDEALLAHALALGARVRRGATVRSLGPAPGCAAQARLADGGRVTARRAVFLATGKHELRGWERSGAPPIAPLVAFKMHFRLRPDALATLDAAVELHLFDGCYAGLQRIEGGIANLCLLAPPAGWEQVLEGLHASSPALAQRLDGAEALWAKPLAVARVPYGWTWPGKQDAPGLWRLGDQAAVTPSFTGDGMAIALHTGIVAAQDYLAGRSSVDYVGALRPVRRQVRRAMLLSHLLLHPEAQMPALRLAGWCPALVRAAARWTRLPASGAAAQPPARARFVKRALPSPVPMVSTAQRETSAMNGTSLRP